MRKSSLTPVLRYTEEPGRTPKRSGSSEYLKDLRHRVAEPLESRTYFSPVVFAQPVFYPTGLYPTAVTTADLTGNGKLDVITADFGTSTIAVLRGNGDGTLDAPTFYPVGSQPQALATGDFNGDGIPDIVVANSASNTISVLLGNGDGTFQPQVVYAAGIRPQAIAVSDLTDDGRLDIITANQGSNSVTVFMNNGDGTFAPAASYYAGLQPDGLAVADLNGDSRPDIVTVNPVNSNLHVLLNQGDGTFKLFGTYDTGPTTRSVGIADMNSDGRPDIVTTNIHGTSVSLLLNNGNATFQNHTDITSGAFPFSTTIADINGDGRPDIITSNNYDNTIGVLVHNTSGGFFPELAYHGGQAPTDVAVADLNGDGRPDLISVDYNTSEVAVDLNKTIFKPLIPTTITVTPAVNPVQTLTPVVLTVQVTPNSIGKVAPIGVVQFFKGDAVIGIAHIDTSGVAHVRVSLTQGGVLTAHYAGDNNYAGGTSPGVIETIVPPSAATPFVAPAITATHFPSALVPGAGGSITLSITNQAAGRADGTVGLQLYASTDGLVDSTAIPLASNTTSIALNLIGGQARVLNVGFTFPISNAFQPGSYTILAMLTPTQSLTAAQVSTTAAAAATMAQTTLAFGKVGHQVHPTLTRTEDGSVVTFKLSGMGTGTVAENSDGSFSIVLANTNGGTNLTIDATGPIMLDDLTSPGLLREIIAPTTTLIGTLSADLGVRTLTLAGTSHGILVLEGQPLSDLSLGTANGLNLFSVQSIQTLAVTSWTNTSFDEITAPWIGQLTSTGDFGAGLALSGNGAPRHQAIGTAKIGGSIGDDVWSLGNGIGTLQVGSVPTGWSGSVKGTVSSFTDLGDFDGEFAAFDFGTVLIDGNVNTADILAGADFGPDGRLGNDDDFFGSGSITSLHVVGTVTASIIAAGLRPVDGDLLDPGTTLQRGGTIHVVTVDGAVDPTTKILAETLPTQASIAGSEVITATDDRFKLDAET